MKQGITTSYFVLAIGFLLVCLLPLITETAPISGHDEQWKNPCGIMSFEPFNTTNQQKAEVLGDVKVNLQEAENMITFLKNEYRTKRVADEVSNTPCVSTFNNDLDNIYLHITGFPDLSSYFLQSNPIDVCENISVALLHDYKNLVHVMIFLEETIDEEYAENNGIYGQNLTELRDSVKGAMCKFQTIEWRCGMEEQNLNATDIVDQYKVTTISDRYRRDYLLVRDMDVLVRSLLVRYNTCATMFSTSST